MLCQLKSLSNRSFDVVAVVAVVVAVMIDAFVVVVGWWVLLALVVPMAFVIAFMQWPILLFYSRFVVTVLGTILYTPY